jgi:hypothetical protein
LFELCLRVFVLNHSGWHQDEIELFGGAIGDGAFGSVYRGRYRGTLCAVKVRASVDFGFRVGLLMRACVRACRCCVGRTSSRQSNQTAS